MTHIPIILTQHAEDAAVLWQRRDRGVNAPHYNTLYLARLDEQLEAHLDGLRIAGQAGWDEAVAAFEAIGGEGEAFTLSTLAFGHEDASLIPVFMEHLKTDPSNLLSAAASGIGWLHRSKLHGKVDPLLSDPNPVARALGVGACAVHRVDPGKRLKPFLTDAPGVRRRAIRLAGELGRADLLPDILALLDDADGKTAYWAAWSAVLLGDRDAALQRLMAHVTSGGAHAEHAMRVALPAMGFDAGGSWLDRQPNTPENTAIKIRGYGIVGDVGAIPWLIEQMADPATASMAGESYAMITGADLEEEDLDGDIPEDIEETPNDDPNDNRVALEEDENLPWADATLIAAHWARQESRFGGGSWYLGRQASPEAYAHGLQEGYQRQRRVAAFWLAVASPEAPLANWQVPVVRPWPNLGA